MDRLTDAKRTALYRQEASACATAALTATVAEIKQAYLDLEQGWLCLAPKPQNSSVVAVQANTALDTDSRPHQAPHCNVAPVVTGQDNL
jgi:hypothetical protein